MCFFEKKKLQKHAFIGEKEMLFGPTTKFHMNFIKHLLTSAF